MGHPVGNAKTVNFFKITFRATVQSKYFIKRSRGLTSQRVCWPWAAVLVNCQLPTKLS